MCSSNPRRRLCDDRRGESGLSARSSQFIELERAGVKRLFFAMLLLGLIAAGCQKQERLENASYLQDVTAQISYQGAVPLGSIGRLGRGSSNTSTYTPDGETIIIGGDVGIYAYSSQTLIEEWALPTRHPVTALAVSPDGELLAVGLENGSAVLVDLENQRLIEGGPGEGPAGNGLPRRHARDHRSLPE